MRPLFINAPDSSHLAHSCPDIFLPNELI